MNLAWFASVWRRKHNRSTVAFAYETLGREHRELLADIALRGGVFDSSMPKTADEAMFRAGVRSVALDIIKNARIDPVKLLDAVEEFDKQRKGRNDE